MNFVVCDFVILVLSIFFDFVFEEYKYVWIYGVSMCKILWFLIMLFLILVVLIFVVILFDCYCVIMYFFKVCLIMVKIKCIIVGIYLFCLLMVMLYFYVFGLKGNECGEIWFDIFYKKYYMLSFFLV